MPKTAQASPQILLDFMEDACCCGDDVIYIPLSSALSGTYQTAVMTRNLIGSERCYVVDSRSATGGQCMIVEYAVRLRNEGKCASEIAVLRKHWQNDSPYREPPYRKIALFKLAQPSDRTSVLTPADFCM